MEGLVSFGHFDKPFVSLSLCIWKALVFPPVLGCFSKRTSLPTQHWANNSSSGACRSLLRRIKIDVAPLCVCVCRCVKVLSWSTRHEEVWWMRRLWLRPWRKAGYGEPRWMSTSRSLSGGYDRTFSFLLRQRSTKTAFTHWFSHCVTRTSNNYTRK